MIKQFILRIEQKLSKEGRFLGLVLFSVLILGGVAVLRSAWLRFQTTGVFLWKVVYRRGMPMVCLGILFCLGVILFLLRNQKTDVRNWFHRHSSQCRLTCILVLIGLVLGIVIAKTRTGLEKENAFFGKPTVPLLEWHLAAAFILLLIVFLLRQKHRFTNFEKWIPPMIWLCAVIVWTAIPNQHGFFSPAGRAPNFETYPFSDGAFYGHFARAAAAGMGFKGNEIPPRPLYIAFLTFLHLLADNQYEKIIFLQTLVLALLPVFVYKIGRDLHSVEAGLCAAAFVILRETHAILAAPFGHNVSSTKYFFSDIPTALVCSVLIRLMIRWQQSASDSDGHAARWAFAAGCALGAMVLIRTQSFVLVFLLAFPLLTALKKSPRAMLGQAALFLAALGICVLPWLCRSYRITGAFVFDHPMTQTAEMARSYNFEGADLSQLPGENDGEYSDRMSAFIAHSLKENFSAIAHFVLVHFANSEISGFRLFPLRDSLQDWNELFRSREPFWETLDSGDLDTYNLCFFALSFLVWAGGISAARQHQGKAGWIPLTAILVFNFSTACGRYSAGRYLIPTDWIMMLYFAIGLAEWVHMLYAFSGGEALPSEIRDNAPAFRTTLLFIALTAAAIPVADRLIPQRFLPEDTAAVIAKTGELSESCPAERQIYTHALALYPRYYAAGEGEPESAKQGYGAVDYGRLVFVTLAPGGFGTFELRTENVPEYLPDGAEVWLNACQSGATSLIETLIVKQEDSVLTYRAEPLSQEEE